MQKFRSFTAAVCPFQLSQLYTVWQDVMGGARIATCGLASLAGENSLSPAPDEKLEPTLRVMLYLYDLLLIFLTYAGRDFNSPHCQGTHPSTADSCIYPGKADE